ncbi:MAG: YjjG family noncanonical pyrimidine nucleotidase [Tannerellaceae bacterium]|jgi:putative hydrolase of the HAD superfamily|nr:YjjG family noncanonical pyrimidine nucleotidase [Tannerellaceae bacterium]
MRRYKTLFFDFDDTLWDTEHSNRQCLEDIYAAHGFSRHYSSFEAFYIRFRTNHLELWLKYQRNEINRPDLLKERFRHILIPAGIDSDEQAIALNSEFTACAASKTALISGTKELLDYLAPHYKLVIVSNGFRDIQYRKLRNAGIESYFTGIILSEESGHRKPHRAIFDIALKSTNSRRCETLMIGDNPEADIAGAQRAGIDQLWYNPKSLPSGNLQPTFEVQTLKEIMEAL